MSNRVQTAPVAEQAVVKTNTGFDRLFCLYRKHLKPDHFLHTSLQSSDDYNFSIKEHELLFSLNSEHDALICRPASGGFHDLSTKVFSSANNWPRNSRSLNPWANAAGDLNRGQYIRDVGRSMVRFVGVASSGIDFLDGNTKDTLAAQTSGSLSIWNTGPGKIQAGDLVMWDFPYFDADDDNQLWKKMRTTGRSGIPASKKLFLTIPVTRAVNTKGNGESADRAVDNFSFNDFLHTVHAHVGDLDDTLTDEAKYLSDALDVYNDKKDADALKDYTCAVVLMYEQFRSRIIGKAMTNASPNQIFDINLARC
jgi:hypothetical protein